MSEVGMEIRANQAILSDEATILHHCPARLPPNPKEVVRTPPCVISIGSFRLLG